MWANDLMWEKGLCSCVHGKDHRKRHHPEPLGGSGSLHWSLKEKGSGQGVRRLYQQKEEGAKEPGGQRPGAWTSLKAKSVSARILQASERSSLDSSLLGLKPTPPHKQTVLLQAV